MPYEIRENTKECSKFGVYKEGSNKLYGCHDNKDKANKQLKALYAIEERILGKGRK